jgi:2-polyprenyl-3-methyl-5-hydroxy-6-metoxy-1,4-benzoquinol methylase
MKYPFMKAVSEIRHGEKLAQGDPEQTWGWQTPAGQIRATRRAKLITNTACLKPGMNVLEIGCGTGLFTELFASTGVNLVAVDISKDLLNIARNRKLPVDRVRFIEARFEELETNGYFDAVIGSSILHHLEVKKSLAKIFGLLKHGGVLCLAEPNMLNPQIIIQKNIPLIKRMMGDSPDETAFIRFHLNYLLKKAGFNMINIIPFDWLHPVTPRNLITIVQSLGGVFEKMPLLREFAGSLLISCRKT